jgi:PAS domain S-box-containing protein
MEADRSEEERLRSVAPQDAESVLAASRRAELELIESRAALEQKTEELIQANRRLTLLTSVANSLMLGDAPQDHLKATFAKVAAEIGAKYYFNYSYDEAKPGLLTLESSGGLERSQEVDFHRIEIERSIFGRVAADRRPLVIENVDLSDDEPTAPLRDLGATAYVGVPLSAHGHLFGAIGFAATGRSRFPEADIELLKVLADQCAAMLDRGRLLENLRKSEARYRTALAAGRAGTWETDLVARTRTWSAEGMALFGLDLVEGRGYVGDETDEYVAALHPDDRHLARHFHELADEQDSFPAEYRVVRPDGSIVWLWGYGQVIARGANGRAERLISIMVDITERKKTEDHIRFLLLEVSHRAKNLLSVIQAIAGQTVRSAGSLEEFETRFSSRLHGLAASHDILVSQSWQGAPLAELVRLQLAPFVDAGSSRLELVGPDVVLTVRAAQAIGLALHELANNAAKYGSLSAPAGKVRVSWAFDDVGAHPRPLRLSWDELGGPPATEPAKKGFGYLVIERLAASAVSGEVAMEHTPAGLRWVLSIPAVNLVNDG